jgi:hypothetical protein
MARGLRIAIPFGRHRRLAGTSVTIDPAADDLMPVRPEPRLRWVDASRPPDGDFSASAIANSALTRNQVPARGESFESVFEFALSYDGYAYWDDLPQLANRVLRRWTRDGALPGTLDELRGCLFHEQRRWHHFGDDPSGRAAAYMWALVDGISALVPSSARAVGPSADPPRAKAPEAHVRLISTSPSGRDPAATRPNLRLVSSRPTTLRAVSGGAPLDPEPGPVARRAVPAGVGGLESVAAQTHVRLACEGDPVMSAGAEFRHSPRRASTHPSVVRHLADLKPMPSADALPKPSVIEPRVRSGGLQDANGGAAFAFHRDDAGYAAWVETHPAGFVLNHRRAPHDAPPTLHRVGCPALAARDRHNADLTSRTPKICGSNAALLWAWSEEHGRGEPSVCRRCRP